MQDLRKSAGLNVADRIWLFVEATPGLREAVEANREYIMVETLTVELEFTAPSASAAAAEDEFDGEKVKVGLVKV